MRKQGLEAVEIEKGGKVEKDEQEWRQTLSADQFHILRDHGTEMRESSPLLHEKRQGTFICAGCGQPLFSSEKKYESGTGWPSFWAPLSEATESVADTSYRMTRTEIRCARCGGHLGHVFPDGPAPTGQRYCMNGAAMDFRCDPAADE